MGEFCRNHTTADDDHAGGQFVQAHDVVVGVDLGGVNTGHGRQHGTGSSGNHDLPTVQAGAVGQLQRVRTDEACVLSVEVYVGQACTPVAAALGNTVDAGGKDTVADLGPVHGIHVRVDAQVLDLAGLLRDGCRVDVHLGGDTAHVQAGSAKDAAVDQCNLLIVPFGADKGVARAGTNHDEVVLGYPVDAFQVFDAHDVLLFLCLICGTTAALYNVRGFLRACSSFTATITRRGARLFP